MANQHRAQIREEWPDKALFANVLLLVAGILGFIHAFIVGVDGIEITSRYLEFIETYPAGATMVLSLVAVTFAIASLRTRDLRWAAAGTVAAFFSFGLVLVEPMLAAIAAFFLVRARLEGEDTDPVQVRLTVRQWPDKTLAASALLVMAGTATVEWWLGLMFGFLHAEGISDLPLWVSASGFVLGLLCFAGAHALYHQRTPLLGVLACLGGVAAIGLFVVAPLLAAAALVLTVLGIREKEFAAPAPAAAA